MTNDLLTNHRFCTAATVLALGVSFIILMREPGIVMADNNSAASGFVEKMKQWQDEMSGKFRDTFKGLKADTKEKNLATASVNLREQKDSYTVRLNLPDRNLGKVEVKLAGDTLHIVAPAEYGVSRYEQTVTLAGVSPNAQPAVERRQKDNLIVINVPKLSRVVEAEPANVFSNTYYMPLSEWDREIFTRMENMEREMNRVFEDSFREFRFAPDFKGFFDEPRFDSMFDLQTEGNSYVIRAYLPERDMNNVNVTVEDRTLKIEAKAELSKKKDQASFPISQKAQYLQYLTLPGSVQVDRVKVDKKDGMLVITLPKAEPK